MKNLSFLIIVVLLFCTYGCNINKKELYVIHIHGDWCKTCGQIDPVIHSLEDYFKSKSGVTYFVFDETNPEVLLNSRNLAYKLDLLRIFEYERHTGDLLFVDKKTKTVLGHLCGVTDKNKYIEATENLLKGKGITSIDKEPKQYKLSKPPIDQITKAKIYVIDIHHDKCGTCEITAPIFEKVAEQYKDNKGVSFFTFDLSTSKTIDETRNLAANLGIRSIYNSHKHTGEVLFVDPKTRSVKNSLVAETSIVKYHEIIDKLVN